MINTLRWVFWGRGAACTPLGLGAFSAVVNDTLRPDVMPITGFPALSYPPFPLQIMRVLTLCFIPCGMRGMWIQAEEHISRPSEVPPPPPLRFFLKPAGATSTSWQQQEKHSQRGTSPTQVSEVITNKIVKFSSTLFIIYFSGRCFSLWMKLIMYSHMGDRLIR